ncbi:MULTISPECIES: DEAD/DEAH box helicase [Bacillus]|uniref:RNA helicase n=1 Tax=Bacillus pumilus TaxID=1408 RepID=A0A2G8ITP0_BACPU|nr:MULTISPECIES: DEAD/DEAH box helicase [Bacillus]MCC9090604.1 DEAD/DEAH box helicase [Bacillus pumilus]MED1749743.1 DEAD/DEAH box helicase [Bacillus zhangzhouensis]PIK26906.1 RNA helicase [Bacillus pumilus]UUD43391.1 DEAD/DEAH box helicase [Bacillus pumilus]
MTETWAFFKEAKPFIQENFEAAGFGQPTAIQEKTAEWITKKRDVIAESPTGTGKTLAYVLPLLNKIDVNIKHPQVLILAPSRELVMQIFDVVQEFKQGSDIKAVSLIGGANIKKQQEKLKKHPNIVVATPGRVQELIKIKKLKMHEVKTIVLDEADQLLVPEHMKTIQAIIKSTLKERQILCFSATLKEETIQLIKEMTSEPEVLKIGRSQEEAQKVGHYYLLCDQRDKVKLLQKLSRLEDMHALVFVRDITNLSIYAEKLAYHHVDLGVLHSEAKKAERAVILKSFEQREFPLLLATDIAARGIDIDDLPYVIHADLPNEEGYIHRSGRTGRAGKEGAVISLVTHQEHAMLKKMAKKLNISLEEIVYKQGQLHLAPQQA